MGVRRRAAGAGDQAQGGETLRAAVSNRLPEGTSIHWHGVPLPNGMDGVPGVTQEPVAPGESFTYEFEARAPAPTSTIPTRAAARPRPVRGAHRRAEGRDPPLRPRVRAGPGRLARRGKRCVGGRPEGFEVRRQHDGRDGRHGGHGRGERRCPGRDAAGHRLPALPRQRQARRRPGGARGAGGGEGAHQAHQPIRRHDLPRRARGAPHDRHPRGRPAGGAGRGRRGPDRHGRALRRDRGGRQPRDVAARRPNRGGGRRRARHRALRGNTEDAPAADGSPPELEGELLLYEMLRAAPGTSVPPKVSPTRSCPSP
ncbi:multicopper oxidase domain-containing protein (plasmid) [Rubrobacter marinus]|uniref:Multicopper oxidase domain-containing protein n=1 Tax=Rubrobacter marinus TaxID=2653852 RepID=A0A6G8Q3U3_9ACTN|nr:multicopper oxidase domain-containing protein [Rubrobacter marinus]